MARIQLSGTQIPTLSKLNIDGEFTLDAQSGTSGQILTSAGSGNTPTWNSAISISGDISAGGFLKSTNSQGDEGGQIDLAKAATNTTLTTGVTMDVYQNKLRIFETGGTNRGFYIDISSGAASVGTNLTLPDTFFYSVSSSNAISPGTNNTNQSLFSSLTNGLSLESATRYEIEGVFILRHVVGAFGSYTVARSAQYSFVTPSLTYGHLDSQVSTSSVSFAAATTDTITTDVVSSSLSNDISAGSATRSTTGTTNQYVYVRFKGFFKTSATGYLKPQIKMSTTDPMGDGQTTFLQAGSWISVTKTPETNGSWS